MYLHFHLYFYINKSTKRDYNLCLLLGTLIILLLDDELKRTSQILKKIN